MRVSHGRYQARGGGEGSRAREAEAQDARLAGAVASHVFPKPLDLAQQRSPSFRHRGAGVGDPDLARAAVEEPHAQLFLELPDLRAQHLLRNALTRCRAREVELLGDGDRIAKVAQLGHGTRL
jgi:hypothetical protein